MERRDRSLLRRLAVPLLAAAFLGVPAVGFSPAPAAGQEPADEIREVRERVERARADHLDLIAPGAFERAVEGLEAAERSLAEGRADAGRHLAASREALSEAERLREAGARALRGALEARANALEADAPRLAPEDWREAEREAREAGRRVERGRHEDAADRAGRAEARYRAAELRAIRVETLGGAFELRDAARESAAHRHAPLSLEEGEELLRRAEAVLEEDRARREEARELGDRAADAFRRAARIAPVADSVRRNGLSVETVIRRQEERAARLGGPLRFRPDTGAGTEAIIEQALAVVEGLQEDRRNLQRKLERTEAELETTLARVDSLSVRLAGLEEREAEVAARLRERERRERRLREVRAIFTEEEGEVLVAGDRLILRLHGFNFPTGDAEVLPEHHSLLTKVQRVIREFPGAPVAIEGHTDSRGNPDLNRRLSHQRAIVVREHLLAAMPISSDRISAVGLGESRPIASNETEEGRERNRRIEVVLDLAGSGGD